MVVYLLIIKVTISSTSNSNSKVVTLGSKGPFDGTINEFFSFSKVEKVIIISENVINVSRYCLFLYILQHVDLYMYLPVMYSFFVISHYKLCKFHLL